MRAIPLFISLSCSLVSSIAAAVTANTPINQTYNYEDDTGAWQTWAYAASSDSTPSYQIISQGVVTDNTIGSTGNHSYQIEAILDTTTYLYFLLPSQLALYGSLNLNANIKVEVISGNASQAEVRLGTSLYEDAFGINGNCPNPFGATIDGQWKSIGGDIMPEIALNVQNSLSGFAQSQASDYLPYTTGPVLYIYNHGATADHQHPLRIRVTIDNVAWNGTVASMTGYKDAATSAAQSYVNRITPSLTTTNQNITSAKTSIDNLSLAGQQALYNQIETEATQAVTSHTNIVNSYSTRTPLHVPTQAQYDQDITNQNSLNNLLNVGNYVASSGINFLFYPWESTGQNALNEQAVGISSGTPQQTVQATLALNKLEPVSIVLQNLFDKAITINQVNVGGLSNQFGEIFPTNHIDTRIVKSWYVGSTSHIDVRSTDVKTRTPMLLLKDDSLINVDDSAKINLLHINSQGTQFYQDVSTPSAQMPNDAVANDATSLQSFTVKSMQSKQLWLTLDSRTGVRPGTYSGSIGVSYLLGSDATQRTLQIPVSFVVEPIQLQNSPLTYSVYYRAKISTGANTLMSSETKSQQQYLAEMKNMSDHGVLYPTQYINQDTNEVANYVTLRKQVGLPCDKYFLADGMANIGTDSATAYNNAIQLRNTLTNSSNCSSPQLYMYGSDEAQGSALDAEKAAMQKIHDAGAKSFVAGYVGTYSHVGDALDTIVFSGTPDDGEISLWRNVGKDVYSYGNPQTGIPNPYIYRSHYGLLLWQHNYTGAMDYAYQDGRPDSSSGSCTPTSTTYCSMWNIFQNAVYYNHEFTFPTTSGVVDTIQWEGFREAVDDTRYLATLQTLVQSSTDSALVTEINNWLATIKTQTNLDPIATRKTMQNYFQRLNKAPTFSNVTVTANGSTVTAKGQATDPEGYLGLVEVKFDNGNWQSAGSNTSWQLGFANISVGSHTVYYRATDYWGASTTQQSTIDVGTHGLTGAYYNNNNFSGSPALTRTDATINFDWGTGSFATGMNINNFSVRWTGKVLPPVTGTYTFCITADDDANIYLNGNSTSVAHATYSNTSPICSSATTLNQGQPIPIQIDFKEYFITAKVSLFWTYPGQSTPVVIPSSQLYAQ